MIKKINTTTVAMLVFVALIYNVPVQADTPNLQAAKQVVGTYLCESCPEEECVSGHIPMVLQFSQDGNFTMSLGILFERFSNAIQGEIFGAWKVVRQRPLTISVVGFDFDYDKVFGEVIEIDKFFMSLTLQDDRTLTGTGELIVLPYQIGSDLPDINDQENDPDPVLTFFIKNCQRLEP